MFFPYYVWMITAYRLRFAVLAKALINLGLLGTSLAIDILPFFWQITHELQNDGPYS